MTRNLPGLKTVEWKSLTANARKHLTPADLDWLMEGAGLFTRQERFDRSIQRAFDNPPWWPAWREWRNKWKELRAPSREMLPATGTPPVSVLPYPPDEPDGLWEEAEHLLQTGTYMESISAALIRLLLAQGRSARQILDRKA